MLYFRRLPGVLFSHVYVVTICLGFMFLLIFVLLSWGFVCSNFQIWREVNSLCSRYAEGNVHGDLCDALCIDKTLDSFSCLPFHAGKDSVFTAMYNGNMQVIFKSAQNLAFNNALTWTESLYEKFPSEEEFMKIIQSDVHSRLNITISIEEAERLSSFGSGSKSILGTQRRVTEMQQIWLLLQDNEYLLAMLHMDKDLFPRVIGSCGNLFAMEYLDPALEGEISKLFSADGNNLSWMARLNIAAELVKLVSDLDSEGLLMCDVKPSHFGLSRGGRVKTLDLDLVMPKVMADRIALTGQVCRSHKECSIFDCFSECSKSSKICDKPVLSSNMQVVCDKIFVGSRSESVVVAGLLMGPETTGDLASLLRQCAAGGISPDSLLDTLTEMHHSLS